MKITATFHKYVHLQYSATDSLPGTGLYIMERIIHAFP
jgi:hypothetical protein